MPSVASRLESVGWIELHPNVDARGSLTAIESGQSIPFDIRRVYFLRDIVADRAGHAHRDTHQVIVPVAGSFVVSLSDGRETRDFRCDDPSRGLYVLPMLFIRLLDFAPGTVALVLASTHYDKSRSLRSWDEYLQALGC
ncbi:MAG: FdtA/QdtA family cupin domain-containing protein [Vicinamibacterales bacterium]